MGVRWPGLSPWRCPAPMRKRGLYRNAVASFSRSSRRDHFRGASRRLRADSSRSTLPDRNALREQGGPAHAEPTRTKRTPHPRCRTGPRHRPSQGRVRAPWIVPGRSQAPAPPLWSATVATPFPGTCHEDSRRRRLGRQQAAHHRDDRDRRPESRRSAGREHGHRHLPHRRLHAVGARFRGQVPGRAGPRGRRHRARGGRRRHRREGRRPRDPALHARMSAVQKLPQPAHQPLHRHPLHPGPGRDAGRHQPLLLRRRRDLPLHGLLDLLELHRAARDRGQRRSARTPPSTRSATSAAASPPASARSSTPPRSGPAPMSSSSASAASVST